MRNDLLRRYTDLPALLHLLKTKCITLFDPKLWDDKNDSHYIEVYREQKGLKAVLALCFTEASERYHHWKVFSGNASGVCIVFHKTKLLENINRNDVVKCSKVIYKKLNDIEANRPVIDDYPFVKRHPFRDDEEFRIIYEDLNSCMETKDFPIELSCISGIVLSPWAPKSVIDSVRAVIKDIEDCYKLKITKTTLVDNARWKLIGSEVLDRGGK
jgi:hypothetical protein